MPYTVQIKDVARRGDEVTVVGVVNRTDSAGTVLMGDEIVVRVWKSHLDTLATDNAKKAYVRQQLKQAYQQHVGTPLTSLTDPAPVET